MVMANCAGQTAGDHWGPARAASRQSSGVGGAWLCSCSLCGRHCRVSPMPGALMAGVGRGHSLCMFTQVWALVLAEGKISSESK
jgi:hypothetical protein